MGRPIAPHSHPLSRQIVAIYAATAVGLVGWTSYLALSLPRTSVARHWNVAWVGLDVLIVIALAGTAWWARRDDRFIVIPAVATTTLLIVDAWMDVTTAAGSDRWQSIVLAVAVELPLAAFSLRLARSALADPQPTATTPS